MIQNSTLLTALDSHCRRKSTLLIDYIYIYIKSNIELMYQKMHKRCRTSHCLFKITRMLSLSPSLYSPSSHQYLRRCPVSMHHRESCFFSILSDTTTLQLHCTNESMELLNVHPNASFTSFLRVLCSCDFQNSTFTIM